jgi:hypothetical protein
MNLPHWLWQHRVPIEGWVFYRRRLVVHTQTEVSCVLFQEFSTGTASPFWLDACGSVQFYWHPIVDQLYDTVPTLGRRIRLPCLAKGSVPWWSALTIDPRKDPATRTESLVRTRLPPRTSVGQRNIIGLYCRPICRPNVSRPIMPIGAQKSNFRLVICLTNTGLEPTACKNLYYYGAKQLPPCHTAHWNDLL